MQSRYLIDHLLGAETKYEFIILQHKGQPLPDYPGIMKIFVPTRFAPLEFLWVQIFLPILLRRYKVDVCHSLKHVGPLFTSVPTIIHVREVGHFFQEGQKAFQLNLVMKILLLLQMEFLLVQSCQ